MIQETSVDIDNKLVQFKPVTPEPDEAVNKTDQTVEEKPKKETKRKKNKVDDEGKKANSKSLKTVRSTQIFSPIRSVRDGIIVTKNGSFVKLMEFGPINFMLRGSDEQKIIINRFASVIK